MSEEAERGPGGGPILRAVPASFPPPSAPVAGWYPDGSAPGSVRYWDGRGWTQHVAVPAGPPAAGKRPAHPTLPIQVAFGAIAVLGVSLLASRVLLDHLVQYRWPILVYVAITAVVAYAPALAWCIVATGRVSDQPVQGRLGLEFRFDDLGWAPLTWVGAVASEIAIVWFIMATNIPISSNTEGVNELAADRTYVVSLLLLAVVAAPIVEEIVFRAVVLRGFLSRMGVPAAIAAQAVLFGLAHVDTGRGAGNIGLAMVTGAIGAAFGVAAYLLRRVGVTIVAHAILNSVVMAIVLSDAFET